MFRVLLVRKPVYEFLAQSKPVYYDIESGSFKGCRNQ